MTLINFTTEELFKIMECINGDGDFDDPITFEEQEQITHDNLGVWEADDEDDLIEEVTTASGWCIKKIDYEIQLK